MTATAKTFFPSPLPTGRLVLNGISKSFADSSVALEDVSLTCEPGEFVVVVGPSGCGKSTLLNIAAGMIKPDGGQVELDGKPIEGPGPDRAMVFQEHGLFAWLTAEQNIEFGLKMAGMPKAVRKQRVIEALRQVHLSPSAGKMPHELSGGMRQRVAIARALVMGPAVLLMDEPFAALDAQTRTLLHEQLQELWVQTRKTIIVLHSHPGRIRREIPIDLPHPRNFDSPRINELVGLVRREIEDEVNRVNSKMAESWWKPATPSDLDSDSHLLGGGI
jgi:NitT/TauT family transport system ATP-binding protein